MPVLSTKTLIKPLTDTDVGFEIDFPVSPLGRRLLEIRRRIVGSGVKLLDWNEIEAEVRDLR